MKHLFLWNVVIVFMGAHGAYATPGSLTYQGRIMHSNGTPFEYDNVSFIFEITNPSGSCVLYREQRDGISMANSAGVFDVPIGGGTKLFPASVGLLDVFKNTGTFDCANASHVPSGVTYSPTASHERLLRVQFHDGSSWNLISPDNVIRTVPFAAHANSAGKLEDKTVADFMLADKFPGSGCGAGEALTFNGTHFVCSNINGATWPATSGTNGQVLTTDGAGQLSWTDQSFAVGTAGTAPGFNSSGGVHTLNIPMASSGSVTAGLISKTDFDSFSAKFSATISSPSARQVIQYNGSNWINAAINAATDLSGILPVANGGTGASSLGSGNILIGGGTGAVTSLASGSAGNIVYGTGIASWASGTPDVAGIVDKSSTQTISGAKAFTNYVQMASGNEIRFADADSSNYVAVRSPASVGSNLSMTLPGTSGSSGDVMTTDGAGNLSWSSPHAPTNVVASGGAVDLRLSNIHYLNNVGGSTITLSNAANGGVYTIVVADTTSREYSFSGCDSSYFNPESGPTTAGSQTIYGITMIYVAASWKCYITWSTDFM
ncbi:hypothetical protein QJS83_08660 [Bdellovibrio sp. 22V]|uniref:hypothetical protein n=1 Tax=Bdellovibrio sp. 22V TaxID=3044166 RepID=UPI002542B919|nr:hypothetical protein [Bdellovibrio sp. 22V]WII70527.1 hypothetical protein QJS83_08660 [Bdellovibrio sp. 22V]